VAVYANGFTSAGDIADKKEWCVLQTKPGKETIVCAHFQRNSHFDIFFPQLRSCFGVRPLFPSYLFINTSIIDRFRNYQALRYARGVLRVLSTRDGVPMSVSSEVVAEIKNRLGTDGFLDQRRIFRSGQAVRIIKGPLKDLIGILEKPSTNEERIQVLFKCLRYPLRAMLKFEDLALVKV